MAQAMNPHETPLNRELIRTQLQVAISGEQTTIELTNEDDTRIRAKTILGALQRINRELERDWKQPPP